jgi:hypothetical protein
MMFTRKVDAADEGAESVGTQPVRRRTAAGAVAVSALAVGGLSLLAACGSSGGSTTAAASGPPSSGATGFAAYTACLQQHGVTLPSRGAGGGGFTRPSDGASRGAGGFGGGYGGGFFGGGGTPNPQMSAAAAACASVRPAGGFGGGAGGFGAGSSALTAFRSCMTQNGVTVPTTRPTAFPPGGVTATGTAAAESRYLGGLSPTDPTVAKALSVCQPLLPTRPAAPPTGSAN